MNRNIDKAAKILQAGGVIAFPTETVFGLGALLTSKKAVARIFKIKHRPKNKPLQILVASLKQARELGIFNGRALALTKKYWPGPLTLVLYKTVKVPKLITGGTNKVGLRIPAHRTTLALLRKCGPLVATSANLAGEPPALRTKEVEKARLGVDYILPGRTRSGLPSKVIDVTGKIKILRF